ncbi:hypothetical protein GCM10009865_50660 [Aeromicrobium ponti]|uniref:S-layer family protein n=1 Tax=Cytobacillus oceanisediminis TaxID=665099 RepID=A0A562J7U7_9BACI|nr:Ig-like domain-containing protein [Cytobacillus oceanisediminis]TWH79256.1 S-layer family protein [Cytobacillus oceanisediminis]
MQSIKSFSITLRVLIVFSIILSLFPYQSDTARAAGTVVSGTITENTVWKKANSPYTMSGIITINSGVTLTIEPGVEVIAGQGIWFDVKGKLNAIGTPEDRIILKDAYVNGWDFVNRSIHLEYTDLYHESFNGGFLVTSSRQDVTLRHNRFKNGLVLINTPINTTDVEYNLFTNGAKLDIGNGKGLVSVRHNTFLNEGFSSEDVVITSREPDGGLPNVEINQNNFFGSNKIKVRLDGYNRIVFNGLDNYWGTTDSDKINGSIVDVHDNINFRDRLNVEAIAYKPYNNGYPLGGFSAPKISEVGDADMAVSGLTDADSAVKIYRGEQLIREGMSADNGQFNIPIPSQSAGTLLWVSVTDGFGRQSKGTATVKDTTSPEVPIVDDVSDLSEKITGKAEPGSSVVVNKGSEQIGTAAARSDGLFEIAIQKQAAGTVLTVYSSDQAGNYSPSVSLTVKDKTPPQMPVLASSNITDQTISVSGAGEIGSVVLIKNGTNTIGSGIVSKEGIFTVGFDPQPAGSILTILAKDTAGNMSDSVTVTVRDVTPPVIKYVSPVTDQNNMIYGFVEAGSIVTINLGETILAEVLTGSDGVFLVQDINPLAAGTILTISAKDSAGNLSDAVTVTVGKEAVSSFPDLSSSHRFYHEISYLLGREIITGFPDGTFRSNQTVTRAQAAIMIGKALKFDGTPRNTIFKDVGASSKASGYIAAATEEGIITGYPDGTFRPDAPVTRGQMAIFLAKAFKLTEEASVTFNDVSTGSKSYDSIKKILADRITTGYPDGTFRPDQSLIRADFSAFMARALAEEFKVK